MGLICEAAVILDDRTVSYFYMFSKIIGSGLDIFFPYHERMGDAFRGICFC